MAVIKLTFQPDTKLIKPAIEQIKNELNSIKGINIKVDAAGAKATQQLATNLQNASHEAKALTGDLEKLTTQYKGIGTNGQVLQTIKQYNAGIGTTVVELDKLVKGHHKYTTTVIQDSSKIQKARDAETKAYVEGYTKAENEIKANQQKTWQAFLQGEKEYQARLAQLEEQKVQQAQAANRQLVIDEENAAKRKHDAWAEYFKQRNEQIAVDERVQKANERAADKVDTLRVGYANLLRTIQNLKALYPEGTFDAIEREATEAQNAVQNLDKSSATLAQDVKTLEGTYKGLRASLAEVRQNTAQLQKVTESFWMNVQKFARWYFGGNIVVHAVRNIKEAVKTMKEVDQELTNIQKVSNLTSEEIERIGDTAYQTASKYGVAANEYLQAVYTFQKAGIGDSSEEMAELATKTMLVGDTTSEVATRFLISANAAWKFKGNVEELNRIVDEADKLNNSYAVTLEDIATGLPIVGATAAQVGMTAEQTMAAISTIVASTGQSASKASTALRAIIMNLIGQTGELEDGTEVTTESINTLNEVLNKYAGDAMKAAQASGKILDPMEAIAALAKAAEDPLVKETQLFEILAGLGGKLRTTQLTALINNLDMYHSMLADTADAAGTADREISVMLDSWNSRTQILKNTWTEFVSKTINSNVVKGGITALTKLVGLLNSGFGHFVTTVWLATVAIGALIKAFLALKALDLPALLIKLATNPFTWIALAVAAVYGLVKAIKALNPTAQELADKAAQAAENYKKLQSEIDQLNSKIEENNRLIAEANQLQDSDIYIARLQGENALLETQLGLLKAQAEEARKQANRDAKRAFNAASYGWESGQEAYRVQGETYYRPTYTSGTPLEYAQHLLERMRGGEDVSSEMSKVLGVLLDINESFDSGDEEAQEYSKQIAQLVKDYNGLNDATQKTRDTLKNIESSDPWTAWSAQAQAWGGLTDEDVDRAKQWFDVAQQGAKDTETLYDELTRLSERRKIEKEAIANASKALSEYGAYSMEAYDAMQALEKAIPGSTKNLYDFDTATLKVEEDTVNTEEALSNFVYGIKSVGNAAKEQLQYYSDLDSAINAVSSAMSSNGAKSIELYNAMEQLNKVAPEVVDKLYDLETGELKVDTAQIEAKESLLDFVDAAYSVKLDGMISELERASTAALDLAGSIAIAMPGGYNDQFLDAFKAENNPALQKLKQQKADWDEWVEQIHGRYQGGGGGGGGGGSTSTSDPELARLQNIVKLRKQEVEFLKASGKSQDEINAKQKEVQAALHDLAEYMRKIEADEADILSLSTEWWTIQNSMVEAEEDQLKVYQDRVSLLKSELSLLEAQGASTDEIVAKQRQIQDALKAQENYMRSIGASQTEINALVTEWYEIENKNLKTQQDLFDQLKRTIDEYYDAAVNDKKKELEYEEKILAVQKAQIALQNAQNERNVRYFNAASGQWEWGANAKNVQSAKEALSKAQDALVDYQEQAAWAEFKAAWEYIAEKIKSGDTTFDQAYRYMKRKMVELQNKYNVDMGDVLEDSVGAFEGVNKTITDLDGQTAEQLGASVKSLKDANTNLGTAVGTLDTTLTDATANAKDAVDAFKSAFDTAKKRVENGEWDIDTAFNYLRKKAKEISKTYGIDMTNALNDAIGQMQTVYSGLNGISEAVQKGALTPQEAFDIISKALNSVSEQYGENIAGEVNRILAEEGGFESGIDDLAAAVASGKLTWDEAFKLLTGAVDQTSEKFGIDGLQGELDTAIQNMGKSGNALEGLWKTIVMNKMRMNSVSWLNLEEQKKQAQAMGDEETVKRLTEQQNALHAENEALGKTIGATYDKSGYWSLNGQNLYDPQADKASGKFDTVTDSGVSPATTGSSKAGGNQDLLDTKWKSSAESHLIPGLGYVNTGEATADLFNLKAGQTGNVARAMLMLYGTDEEKTQYFNGGGIPASLAERLKNQPQDFYYSIPATSAGIYDIFKGSTNAKGQYSGGAIVYKGGAGDSVVQVKNGKVMATGLQDMGSDIILTPDGRAYRMDSKGNLIDNGETWSNGLGDLATQLVLLTAMFMDQQAMADSGNFSNAQIYGSQITYDEGGVLHGIGGIKATARDEMVLPPDITERLLTPINNGFVRGRMDDLRSMLGMQTEFGSVDNTRIGTQNNGDIYTMNGVTISEGQARVTTVYDLAQMARNLGAYKRS